MTVVFRWTSYHTVATASAWHLPLLYRGMLYRHLQEQYHSFKESALALESGKSYQAKVKKMAGCFHMAWIRLPHTLIISVLKVSSLKATGQLSHFNFTFVSFLDLCK